MQYDYSIGETVRAIGGRASQVRAKVYEIVRAFPSGADEMPWYRVRSLSDGVEWTVRQDRIEPASLSHGAARHKG